MVAANSAAARRDGAPLCATALYARIPAAVQSEVTVAIATQLIAQQVATPIAVALHEWRRTLRMPTHLELTEHPPVTRARLTLGRLRHVAPLRPRMLDAAAGSTADPWTLATAPWITAAVAHSRLMLGRIWGSVRPVAAALRSRAGEEGTPLGDLQILRAAGAEGSDRSDGRAQLAALERTVDRIRWHPRNPAVRRALAARAAPAGDVGRVKRQELRAAVYLVLAERGRPQAHRFGRSWLTDHDGRVTTVAPEQLEDALFWRWFCDEVRKAAEASLLDEAYTTDELAPGGLPSIAGAGRRDEGVVSQNNRPVRRIRPRLTHLADDESNSLADPSPGPLDLLLAQEDRQEQGGLWRAAIDAASPRQRHLLAALVGATGDGGRPAESIADAARQIGIAPSTARVQWKRLVDRLRSQLGIRRLGDL